MIRLSWLMMLMIIQHLKKDESPMVSNRKVKWLMVVYIPIYKGCKLVEKQRSGRKISAEIWRNCSCSPATLQLSLAAREGTDFWIVWQLVFTG